MTQMEPPPEANQGNRSGIRRSGCYVWMMLGLFLLIPAGSATLIKCPWLYPSPHQQSTADNAALEQRVAALEARIANLSGTPPSPAPSGNSDVSTSVKDLQSQVETLQKQNEDSQQAARKVVASTLSFWELREAVAKGRSFAEPLANFLSIDGGDAAVAEQVSKLEPYASSPPPTMLQLQEVLIAQEATLSSAATQEANTSWWEHIKELARPLISVRPLHDPQYQPLEEALKAGDSQAALAAFKTLPDDTQKKLDSLRKGLDVHKSIDDALGALQKILEGVV